MLFVESVVRHDETVGRQLCPDAMVAPVFSERPQVGTPNLGGNLVGFLLRFHEWLGRPFAVGGKLLRRVGMGCGCIPFEIPDFSCAGHRYGAVCNGRGKAPRFYQRDQVAAGFNGLGLKSSQDCLVEVFDRIRLGAPPFAKVGRPEVLGIKRILPTIHAVDQADQAGEAQIIRRIAVRTEFFRRPLDGQSKHEVGIPTLHFPVQHDQCRHVMPRQSAQIVSHDHVADITDFRGFRRSFIGHSRGEIPGRFGDQFRHADKQIGIAGNDPRRLFALVLVGICEAEDIPRRITRSGALSRRTFEDAMLHDDVVPGGEQGLRSGL